MANLLQITRGCEYAISAMQWIAEREGRVVQADEIARSANIPPQFAGNILTRLAKAALLRVRRGAERGYTIARPANEISLLEIVESYDGPFEKPWCFMDRERMCNSNSPCALHDMWLALRDHTRQALSTITLDDIVRRQVEAGRSSKAAKVGIGKKPSRRGGTNATTASNPKPLGGKQK